MPSNENGVNGHANGANGVNGSVSAYSIPQETANVFQDGILNNSKIASTLPEGIEEAAKAVSFEGTEKPSIPINWRFAESISALKGLEAAMVNVLLKRKYGLQPQKAVINTDHAQLFVMSILLNTIDPEGASLNFASAATPKGKAAYEKYFKNTDLHDMASTPYRTAGTNIYRCKDGRYFHLHGSMNPTPSLESIGLPPYPEQPVTSIEGSWKPHMEKVGQIDSEEMQRLASDVYKQAGTIAWTTEEFKNSEHGKANAHVGLYEVHPAKNEKQAPCWWPDSLETSPARPLAGLKVVDLTRIIAAPAVSRGLAELGASVMRITAEHITDMHTLHADLSWGKWSAHLDFRKEEDRKKLRALVKEADVVLQGYRPGVLDKYGFDLDGLLEITKDRERGLIVARENCYGWNGPWSYRSGWQQISDANTGVSMEFGRAMGNDEPVTPVFPNSDFCTGVAGTVAILNALLRRAAEGGSYKVDIALNYYSAWLVNSVGTYPKPVWEDVWSRNGRQVFRHYHNMQYTLPRFLKMLQENSGKIIFNPAFFEKVHSGAINTDIVHPKPVIQFPDGRVQLKYNVGTRGNGVDQPKWPENLMTEIAT
ncbi:CoA-transferase family III domain-containing protein [Lophiotrema nucula]|uniref:CoA-transferase family III domain-containing protein n=1 Tax=Lophiotrema nucula TaxID=690887 RepID=A0A6A5Z6N5_9PLEO|nr:CoA-transferase family III domain-containing protein [Lophiotrema nucula]